MFSKIAILALAARLAVLSPEAPKIHFGSLLPEKFGHARRDAKQTAECFSMAEPTLFHGKAKIRPERNTLLLPYQADWVKDNSRLKLAEKGRQLGWTWCSSYRLDSTTALASCKHDAWISSRDDLQARLMVEDCKAFSTILQLGAADLGEKVIDEKGNSAYVLAFANGRRIHSMSSNPDAQAGKRGTRVIDEAALHREIRKLYSIAYHGITWGGSLEMFSTHRGSGNFFNKLVQEAKHGGNPKGFSLHTVTLQTALDQGFLFKLQSKLPEDDERQGMDEADYYNFIKKGCASEESFLEECMCVPSDDDGAFLSFDLIDGCTYPEEVDWEHTITQLQACPNPLYLGVDVGRRKDMTVMWVLEKVAGLFLTRKVLVCDRETFTAQEAKLYELLALPNLRRACMDDTGIGMQFCERAQERFGSYRVEGVTFTGPVKEELAYPVRAAFEDKSLRIPKDRVIEADLRDIRKTTTGAGNIRFAGERTEDGHCDRFWGLALALHAAKNPDTGAIVDPGSIRTGGNSGLTPRFLPARLGGRL